MINFSFHFESVLFWSNSSIVCASFCYYFIFITNGQFWVVKLQKKILFFYRQKVILTKQKSIGKSFIISRKKMRHTHKYYYANQFWKITSNLKLLADDNDANDYEDDSFGCHCRLSKSKSCWERRNLIVALLLFTHPSILIKRYMRNFIFGLTYIPLKWITHTHIK